MTSNTFEENIIAKCEEIASNDNRYIELSKRSNRSYKKMLKAINEYVNVSSEFHAYSEILMYRSNKCTAQNTAQNKNNLNDDVIMCNDTIRKAIK